MPKSGVKVAFDRLKDLTDSLSRLVDTKLMVGIPRETTDRNDDTPFTNADIGYVQEFGDAAGRIPPRPFLYPTVKANRKVITDRLKIAGKFALDGKPDKVIAAYEALGLFLQAEVRKKIVGGIPPPLAESTVRARIRRRKSKAWRAKRTAEVEANLAAGAAAGAGIFTPLIDTSNLLGAITYVVRSKLSGRDVKVGKRNPAKKV